MRDLFVRVRDALDKLYDIRRVVGTGGMATVFEAWDRVRDESVAIKVLKPQLARDVPRERFRREVAVASRLDHPNIVPILTSGERGGIVYCVMPFVAGETLRQRLRREKTIPLPEAILIAREITDALTHAHEHGIMHRDIKPENILLSDGKALVTDFGIARAIQDDGSSLTITGSAVGTPKYMSPEQAFGKPVDPRTDLYSLGCVLHEMIAGTRPFADSPSPVARDPLEPVKPVSAQSAGEVPLIVDELVAKTLEWNPDNRYARALDLRTGLLAAQRVTGLPRTPTTSRGSLFGWATLAAGASALLLAGFLVARIVGPAPAYTSLVSIAPPSYHGPASQQELAATFSKEMTRVMQQKVGIGIVQDNGVGNREKSPHYVLNWGMEIETAEGSATAKITIELRSSSLMEPFWRAEPVTTLLTDSALSAASAELAMEVAAAIRAGASPKP